MKDNGPENSTVYRYVLVVFDKCSGFGGTVPLKDKNAQTVINSFEKILETSKRIPKFIETDRGEEFFDSPFQIFSSNDNIKQSCTKSSLAAVFAEKYNLTIRNHLKGPVFEKGNSNWLHFLPKITKQYNNRVHSSTNLTPIQASFKKTMIRLPKLIRQKKEKNEKSRDIVRTADLKKTFSKSDATNWSYTLYEITENFLKQYQVTALRNYQSVIMKPY